MSIDPPLRCAVLVEHVPVTKPEPAEPMDFSVARIPHLLPNSPIDVIPACGWRLLFANCDIVEARELAAPWSRENIGCKAVVMVYDDYALSGISTAWAKP